MPADRSAWDEEAPESGVAIASRPPHEQSLEPEILSTPRFEGAQFPCRFADLTQNARKDVIIRLVVDGRYADLTKDLMGQQQTAMHCDLQRWSLAYADRD